MVVYVDTMARKTDGDLPAISDLVELGLAKRGIALAQPVESIVEATALFVQHGLRLLVLLDEVEAAYVNVGQRASCEKLQYELYHIGGVVGGTYAAYLCGSSSCLPQLISARKESAVLLKTFPLLEHAVDLNGSKFPQHHLASAWISDADEYRELLSTMGARNASTDQARQVALMCGCNLRFISQALKRDVVNMREACSRVASS